MSDKPAKICIACGVTIPDGSIYLRNQKQHGPVCLSCKEHIYDIFDDTDSIRDIIAHVKHVERHRGLQDKTPSEYLALLTEEFLELTRAINNAIDDGGPVKHIRAEAIHVAQVAIDIVRCYDRNNWGETL